MLPLVPLLQAYDRDADCRRLDVNQTKRQGMEGRERGQDLPKIGSRREISRKHKNERKNTGIRLPLSLIYQRCALGICILPTEIDSRLMEKETAQKGVVWARLTVNHLRLHS